MSILFSKRITVKSKNDTQQDVFGIVESIRQHVHYEEQDDVKQQRTTLLSEGNKKITARKNTVSAKK